jgi:hypothetical protein
MLTSIVICGEQRLRLNPLWEKEIIQKNLHLAALVWQRQSFRPYCQIDSKIASMIIILLFHRK